MPYIIFITLILSGCGVNYDKTLSGRISNYSQGQLENLIIDGVTTKKDILLAFGQPNTPEDYNHINQWFYHSKIIDEKSFVFVSTSHNREQWLKLEFNDKNRVVRHSYKESL